jgi:hypothetical protein
VKPVLNVFGLDLVQLEASTNSTLFYDDPGATCTDSIENDISDDVDVRGAVYPDYSKPGKYELKYVCTNSAGDSSDTETRTVIVADNVCPSCTMASGPQSIEASFPYIDAGATCSDSFDGPVQTQTTNNVNVERTGTYFVTYRAHDDAGNWNNGSNSNISDPLYTCAGATTSIRTVIVVDTLKPVLALSSGNQLLQKSSSSEGSLVNPLLSNPAGQARRLSGMTDELESDASNKWSVVAAGFAISTLIVLAVTALRQMRRQPAESKLDLV